MLAPEQKHWRLPVDIDLYADFRIPQLPLGNRWQIGGIPANVTPLHPYLLYTMDAGGGRRVI